MEILTRQDLPELVRDRRTPAVSLYFPTDREGVHAGRNVVRFKNLLRDTRAHLLRSGMTKTDVSEYLAPLAAAEGFRDFWRRQSRGLAIFYSGDFFRRAHLHYAPEELFFVADTFHVKPLLPLLTEPQRCWVLALSEHSARLYSAARGSIEEREAPGMPRSLQESLPAEEIFHEGIQRHPGPARGRPRTGGQFHGHRADKSDERQLRYFRAIDAALRPVLEREPAPLVLASVDEWLPLFKEACTAPGFDGAHVPGSPENASADGLREKAWLALEPSLEARRRGALRRMTEAMGTGRATTDVREAAKAACAGRVDTCAIALDEHRWGLFDERGVLGRRATGAAPSLRDLLDVAAVETLAHGGRVVAVPGGGRVPGDGPIAALLRY